MSTSGARSYNTYYGGSSNDRDAQDACHTGRSSGNSASTAKGRAGPQASASLQHNNDCAYNWPGTSRQNYSILSGDPQSYENNAGHVINDQRGQQAVDGFQRQQSGHSNPISNSGDIQHSCSSTIHAVTQKSTQRRHNLGCASGLEGRLGIRTGGSESTSFSADPNTRFPQARVSSPVQSTLPTYSNQRPSAYSSRGQDHSSSSQQDLAASAAAALAGAVSRRQSNQQSPVVAHHQPSKSKPSIGNAPSRHGNNTEPSNMTSSRYGVSASKTSLGTQQSAQHSQALSPHMNSQTHHCASNSSTDMSTLGPTAKAQAQNRVSNQVTPPLQNRSHVPDKTAQSNSSIANLVTNNSPQESLIQDDQQRATLSDVMPCFNDPSQVFNPYHEQHEQEKRDEAEAKAEARMKVDREPMERPETGSQVIVTIESTTTCPSSLCAPEKPWNVDKSKVRKSGPVPSAPSSPVTRALSQMTLDVEEDMASQMKAMIERMREWKRKYPSMFQRLWDEMKKCGASTSSPTRSARSPSPQIAKAALQQTRSRNSPTAASSSKFPTARRVQDSGLPAQLNGYKVVVENNDEGLPDLGRFPAERRYRQPYRKRNANVSNKGDDISSIGTLDPSLAQPVASGAQPVPQRLKARTSTGNTTWPEEKRQALAEAAVKVLKAEPANLDKEITAQAIRGMLEQNPSYIDLCKLLEDRGLKFHRGQFARQLLSKVPDLSTTRSKGRVEQPLNSARTDMGRFPTVPAVAPATPMQPTTSAPQVYSNGSHQGSVNVETSPQTTHPNQPFLNQTPNGYAPQSFSTAKSEGTPVVRVAKASLGVPSPSLPPPVPGSKDALSRKRNLSELVDLTQLSDDEDYVMPTKQPRLQEPSPELKAFIVTTDASAHDSESAGQAPQGRSALTQSLPFNLHQPPKARAQARQTAQRPRGVLARPIDKSEALRKSYYDPKTVARDVLIAAGRHPSERPLNAHFVGLLHRHIELDSDLSTFDWDVVDPGGPPMPQVEEVDIPAGPPKWKLGVHRRGPRSVSEDEPIREHLLHRANPTPAAITSLVRLSAQTQNLLRDSERAARAAGQKSPHLRHSQTVHDAGQDGISTTVTPQKREATRTRSHITPRAQVSRKRARHGPTQW